MSAAPTEKLAVGCVEGVPAMVSPLKVGAALNENVHAVPVIVMVPRPG